MLSQRCFGWFNRNIIITIIVLHWSHMQCLAPVLNLEDWLRQRLAFDNLFNRLSFIIHYFILRTLFFFSLILLYYLFTDIVLNIIISSITIGHRDFLLVFLYFAIVIIITILLINGFLFFLFSFRIGQPMLGCNHIYEFLMFRFMDWLLGILICAFLIRIITLLFCIVAIIIIIITQA